MNPLSKVTGDWEKRFYSRSSNPLRRISILFGLYTSPRGVAIHPNDTGYIQLTHLRRNKLSHTIYWKCLFSIIGMSGYMM